MGLAALVYHFRSRIHFDWGTFVIQVRQASLWHVFAGTCLILVTYWLRSIRWAVFLSPVRKVPIFSLVGSQFIGFTAVALFGRLADLTRPYLISKRVGLSVSSQVAVYTVERMFDLGAAAVLFSLALAITPRTAPHHEIFVRSGILALAGTAFLAIFALAIRLAGPSLAGMAESTLGRVSRPLGAGVAEKILGFREGLNVLSSVSRVRDGLAALACALDVRGVCVCPGDARVHPHAGACDASLLACDAADGREHGWLAAAASDHRLVYPGRGDAAAMYTFYGAPLEASTACGGVLV